MLEHCCSDGSDRKQVRMRATTTGSDHGAGGGWVGHCVSAPIRRDYGSAAGTKGGWAPDLGAAFSRRIKPSQVLTRSRKPGTWLNVTSEIVKNIGLEMMEDPEFKGEILEPLKMMGVVDITDGALVVRFKFTARPGNPTIIQRNALKRMVPAFQAAGIVFGNTYVAVQTAGAPIEPATGAVASLAIAKQKAGSAAVGS
jgi:hypothetical protein